MDLVVVSSAIHFRHEGKLYAYGPYAREIEIWADLFDQVTIAAPCRQEAPPGDALAFLHSNIGIAPQPEVGGMTISAKAGALLRLPMLVFQLVRSMLAADAVHVRCPGNLGLLGTLLAPLCSRRRIAKYAGQWQDYPGEGFSVRLQRRILGSWWWRAPVTVYGRWPNQRDHVIPFFTSMMDDAQIERARQAAARARFGRTLRLVFVGRLSEAKNVDVMLDAMKRLRDQGLATKATVVGEGPERGRLEAFASQWGLDVVFTGGVAFDKVFDAFEQSDVLVLVSETEGWPKAISEAMAFGLVCIGTNRGLVPEMLGEGRGCVCEPRDAQGLADTVAAIAREPEKYIEMRRKAAAYGQRYSIEGLREALRQLMNKSWGANLRPPTELQKADSR